MLEKSTESIVDGENAAIKRCPAQYWKKKKKKRKANTCIIENMGGAVAEWVRALALNEWRPDILPGRVRLPLRATLSSELWQFR